MAGKPGKGGAAPKGNQNARKHGFYADCLSDDEAKLYEAAQYATLGDELAMARVKLNGLFKWMLEEGNEITDGTRYHMDRMMARVGDLEVKRSIIERNAKEAGMGEDDDPTGMVATIQRHGAHRTTFKNGKSNGNGKAQNGSD